MTEKDCSNCLQVKNLDDKMKGLWKEVEASKAERKELSERVKVLEEYKVETKGKFERIFEALEAIEKNVEKIATNLERINNKGSRTFEGLKYEIIRYVVLAVLAAIVLKFK